MPYQLSPQALRDLDLILRYRSREAGSANAARLNADLTTAFATIGDHPLIGAQRQDLTPRPYRFWRKGVYWIVYEVDAARGHPIVVRVIDARREVVRLLR
ncbi:MAG: ParE toxin of type toxin-antitoxin system, parDE [Geminicoccaceae bacterium]|jgi:plasmid stabilization system protein ParE|nr:ParE toxin of type toxin-antitoxin system, parDE [Geminicoccaceae bacterium]